MPSRGSGGLIGVQGLRHCSSLLLVPVDPAEPVVSAADPATKHKQEVHTACLSMDTLRRAPPSCQQFDKRSQDTTPRSMVQSKTCEVGASCMATQCSMQAKHLGCRII